MAAILARPELSFLHPAARAVGGPAVRNMATVGGNLFAPSPYGDLAVALLALDAQVLLASGYGQPRATPLEEFFASRDRGNPGLVAAVSFNRPGNPGDLRFRKVSRVKPKGLSVLTIAALLPMAGGRVSQARVAYGAMGPLRCAPAAWSGPSKAGRSTPARSPPPRPWRSRARGLRPTRSPVTGIAARCCRCISAGCSPARPEGEPRCPRFRSSFV